MSKFCKKIEQIRSSLKKLSDSLIRSFMMSDLSDSLMVAHFLWATLAICSWSLIFFEQTERFAHSRSFLVSDLSNSLTITHFLWATWANCSWSLIFGERPEWFAQSGSFLLSNLSKWANEQIPSPAMNKCPKTVSTSRILFCFSYFALSTLFFLVRFLQNLI